MLLEVLITLEVIAFIFLALGVLPFHKKDNSNSQNLPLANKVLFILVAAIIFFMLGLNSASFDYNYCYVNQTISDFSLNQTTSLATCNNYVINNGGLAFMNMMFGLVSIVLMIIIVLIAIASKNDHKYLEE